MINGVVGKGVETKSLSSGLRKDQSDNKASIKAHELCLSKAKVGELGGNEKH